MAVHPIQMYICELDENGNPVAGAGVTLGVVALTPVNSVAPTNVTSTALEASHILKATPGTLFGVSGFNSKATAQYIQLHNSATLPADTAVPVVVVLVPALSPFSIDYSIYGRAFSAGIVVCNSSTLATKTIGAADCWFDGQLN